MKRINFFVSIVMLFTFVIGCQKTQEVSEIDQLRRKLLMDGISNTDIPQDPPCSKPYDIRLVWKKLITEGEHAGRWEWIWSIQNPNPGNGENGTIQDLSHWGITLPECVTLANIKLAKAFTLTGEPLLWAPFTPTYQPDKSFADCPSGSVDVTGGKPILKFNYGTTGSTITYYALVIDKDLPVDEAGVAFYKSGCNIGGTGTGVTCFPGVGCPPPCEEGCSFSQGYYFAKPNYVWPGNVTIGGYVYTQAEGKAIWESSNRGGISDAKKAFLQVAAIKLSGSSVGKCATVWNEVKTAENWLKTLPKLTPDNIKNYRNKSVGEAAGRIGRWIDANHCKE